MNKFLILIEDGNMLNRSDLKYILSILNSHDSVLKLLDHCRFENVYKPESVINSVVLGTMFAANKDIE